MSERIDGSKGIDVGGRSMYGVVVTDRGGEMLAQVFASESMNVDQCFTLQCMLRWADSVIVDRIVDDARVEIANEETLRQAAHLRAVRAGGA